MKIVKPLLLVAFLCISHNVHAMSWSCANNDLEVQCHAGKCEGTSEFTPVSVVVDADSGDMQVCAYSGCYEGKGVVTKNDSHVVFSGHGLVLTTNSDEIENFIIGMNIEKSLAVINGAGFAMPMFCKKAN